MNNFLALIDGGIKGVESFGQGGLVAILCIVMVFLILAIIIGITYVVNILINRFAKPEAAASGAAAEKADVDLNNEDVVAAVLVASIDYRNETKKNIKVISVKEIK